MKAIFKTDTGKVRPHNEDSGGIFMKNESYLAVVADGMGGHNAGEVASKMTVDRLAEQWKLVEQPFTPEAAETWLRDHINLVNKEVYEHSLKNKECEGMGTTVVAAICTDSFATIAHIGDSRVYLWNENGFNLITDDHTLVNELVKAGQLSPEDAEMHPRKNVILRSVGTDIEIEIDIMTVTFEVGDLLVLCSDGLSNKVSSDEMHHILKTSKDLEVAINSLIDLANKNGGEDNISIAIIESCTESECS